MTIFQSAIRSLGLAIACIIALCVMAIDKGCDAVWPGDEWNSDLARKEMVDPTPPRQRPVEPAPVVTAKPKAKAKAKPAPKPRPEVPLTVKQARQWSRCQGLNCGHDVRPHVKGALPWYR